MLQSIKHVKTHAHTHTHLTISTPKYALLTSILSTSSHRSMGANPIHTSDSQLPLLIKLIEWNQPDGNSIKWDFISGPVLNTLTLVSYGYSLYLDSSQKHVEDITRLEVNQESSDLMKYACGEWCKYWSCASALMLQVCRALLLGVTSHSVRYQKNLMWFFFFL